MSMVRNDVIGTVHWIGTTEGWADCISWTSTSIKGEGLNKSQSAMHIQRLERVCRSIMTVSMDDTLFIAANMLF